MSMSKKDFIAIANKIREHNRVDSDGASEPFTQGQINSLAWTFQAINPNFMRDRWLGYISGKNGSNGGAVKGKQAAA